MPVPRRRSATPAGGPAVKVVISGDQSEATVRAGKYSVALTHLQKVFWPSLGITKGDLLRYYLAVSPVLLPYLKNRAMVMKRYPNGIRGKFFFMKHTPKPHPAWLETCVIEHASGNMVDFPMIQNVASLLWIINLGCIDLNQWYSRCDDVDRPDYLHFDLDPGPGASFERVTEVALHVRDTLHDLGMTPFVKTSGATGLHIYIPIVRGPLQKEVWKFAKALAGTIATRYPKIATVEYFIADRPRGRVLVDYNQNVWGKTLASVYSVRPTERATVSTPVTWKELERGVKVEQFRIDNVPARIAKVGDLWAPVLEGRGRFELEQYLGKRR